MERGDRKIGAVISHHACSRAPTKLEPTCEVLLKSFGTCLLLSIAELALLQWEGNSRSKAMANRSGGRSAAVVAMALLAAMLIVGEAEAGRQFRNHHHHHHHDSPPAPPGHHEPRAAPSPYFRGEPSPADGPDGFPFAGGPEAGGPESSRSRGLSESGSFADSPFAFGEGPDCPPGADAPDQAAGPEGYHPQRVLSESDGFADSPFAFGEGPAPGEVPVFGEGPAPEAGC